MKPETLGWVERGEGDWRVARREMGAPRPEHNVVCFLAQQCAEKYLKAFLEEHRVLFRKTHDLVVLLSGAGGRLSELEPSKAALARLATYAVAARYPGAQADRAAALEAMRTARRVRAVVRKRLQISRARRRPR